MTSHFFLHTGNRTEALFAGVKALIEAEQRPFGRWVFLVQARGMERWLEQRLADTFGVWMGSEFPFPQTFFDRLAAELDDSLTSDHLQRERVRWRIEALLREPEFACDPLLQELLGEGRDRHRFLLAEQIANLFDQYQIFRPDWLEAWAQGRRVTENPHEGWQMRLWQALGLRPHRGELWRRLIEHLETIPSEALPNPPDQLFAFGITFLPPVMLEALLALSRHLPVHLFTLSPTATFWADLPSRRAQLQLLMPRNETESAEEAPTFHPLLLALGRQGAHFQQLLLAVDEQVEYRVDYFQPPAEETLLAQLQRDLLANRVDRDAAKQRARNILFHRCHTPQREVEVLRDRVVALLEESPDLRLNEIVVMAPDLTPYRPFITTLFAEIPHTIADRTVEMEAPAIKLLTRWLTLVSGRIDWDELFGFLYDPEVAARLELSPQQLEALYDALIAKGRIRWGLAGELHRNHWWDGIQRLLLGAVMAAPETLWQGHAPVAALEGQAIRLLAPILELLERIARWQEAARSGLTAAGWGELIGELANFFYRDAPEGIALFEAAERLALEAAPLGEQPIALETLAAWSESLGAERRSSAGFLSHGITFCDLLPMRSIPIRVAFLLGMNDKSYPRPRWTPAFDLMRDTFRLGDRDLRAEDRHTFLELLLSVRERLEILWQGLSPDKNSELPPAQVVLELRDTLHHHYGVNLGEITWDHRAYPFHSDYFRVDGALQGRSPEDFATCRALHAADKTLPPLWQKPLATPEAPLPLATLSSALADPVRWALQEAGLSLPRWESPPEPREKLDVDGLDRWALREAVKVGRREPIEWAEVKNLLTRWQAEGRWPLGAVGDQTAEETVSLVTRLQELIAEKALPTMGEQLPAETIERQIGAWRLIHRFPERFAAGQVVFHPHRLKGSHRLHFWLSHLLLNAHQEGQTTWVGYFDTRKKERSEQFPALWRLLPVTRERAEEELAAWLDRFARVLVQPPLWHADWIAEWLSSTPERREEEWWRAATLATGLRAPGEWESEPDAAWRLFLRHEREGAVRDAIRSGYESLVPLLEFWNAHEERLT
ncbi:exodeoxyribonuclease V subunit gamma [Hydrogenophilus islandicus]